MIALVYRRWQCFLSNFEDQVDKKIISKKYTKLINSWLILLIEKLRDAGPEDKPI